MAENPWDQYSLPAMRMGDGSEGYTMPRKPDGRQMTFARMQKDGMARPAPMMTNLMDQSTLVDVRQMEPNKPSLPSPIPTYTPSPTAAPTLPAPSRMPSQPFIPSTGQAYTGDPTTNRLREVARQNLAAEFSGQRQALEEDLARRGLAASSIGGGRLGDLAGQQARALAGMEADLLQQEQARQMQYADLMTRLASALSGGF